MSTERIEKGAADGSFSLLWEKEESFREWRGSLFARDKGYIDDLNLRLVYEDIFRAGRFWERYGFEQIFLHPCAEISTVEYRQGIMRQLYRDSVLSEAATEFVSCVSALEKRLERFGIAAEGRLSAERRLSAEGKVSGEEGPSLDETKRRICALQIRYDFLQSLVSIHEKISGHLREKTPLSEAAERLAGFVSDSETAEEREELRGFLSELDRSMPDSIILNKNRDQISQSVVIDPEGTRECGFTERLARCAEPFLGTYDFRIGVYQNTDISCLDKRIQGHVFIARPQFAGELEDLCEKYGKPDVSRFVQTAKELVFYLSCIRFVREYESEGFYFAMPVFAPGREFRVKGAYDMTLGINLHRRKQGCGVVANDYGFDANRRIFILTGANQGGKTTFLRSVGLIQCLAQVGMFVPCREAALGMTGQIHTHFSREDERGAVVGRFEQELGRVREILINLRAGDMVLLNETFTSTQRSTAVALLRRLLQEIDRRGCVGGLVTHFYEAGDGLEGNGFYSLVTEMAGDGDRKERTYRIGEGESLRYSFARDIAVKCGVTYEKLTEVLG